jgi:hypothetical protein
MDFDRGDRVERTERAERPERSEAPPVRAERPDRPERVERAPRGRPPRREPQREESDEAAGLPAFLTNPVRTVLPSDIDEAPVPAPRVPAPRVPAPVAVETDEPEIRPRRRAVRRPRADEAGNAAEANDAIGNQKAKTPAE